MNFLFGKSSGKMGLWNEAQFARKIGLSSMKFKKILNIEVERYVNSKRKNFGKDYKFKADELKYGGIPLFDGFHDKRQKFREESAKFLVSKYGKTYNFSFDPKG